ncbi:MAG: anion transporter [Proteobacteria bacterium]|nr:MAG: anion transporter [Pseudomonadota bacterium]
MLPRVPSAEKDDASAAGEAISPLEARFERARRTAGLFAGPLLFAVLLAAPVPAPNPEAARLVAVLGWVMVWWLSEAVPIPVTALLGPALAVALGVGTPNEIFAPFGDPIVIFFIGGFVIAEGISSSGLGARIARALLAQRAVARSPVRILAAFGVLAGAISAWIPNTATTAMLYPIGLKVLATALPGDVPDAARRRFTVALLLTIAYAASIGGVATPIGTTPNLVVLGQLAELADVRIPFFQWASVGAPAAAAMIAVLFLYLRSTLPRALHGGEAVARAVAPRTPLSPAERNALVAFAVAVTGWVLPGVFAIALGEAHPTTRAAQRALPEAVVAVVAATLLFVLPVDWRARRFTLGWQDAARIDWGTLLLFGGGLALGGAMFRSGLAEALGGWLVESTGSRSVVALTFLFAAATLVLTELIANTGAATMLAPLAIASAQAAGVSPVPPALAVAIASSMAFMLPISTPPNAIVYGSGRVPIGAMVRHGVLLDVASALVVPVVVLATCRALGLD